MIISHFSAVLLFALYSITVIIISLAVFQWVEEPARRYLRRKLTATPTHPASEPVAALS